MYFALASASTRGKIAISSRPPVCVRTDKRGRVNIFATHTPRDDQLDDEVRETCLAIVASLSRYPCLYKPWNSRGNEDLSGFLAKVHFWSRVSFDGMTNFGRFIYLFINGRRLFIYVNTKPTKPSQMTGQLFVTIYSMKI